MLALAARVGRAAGLQHARPEPTGGAQLRDRGELLVGGGVAELQEPGRARDVEPGVGERPQVRHARRHREAQLLRVGAARGVHREPVDDDRAHQRVLGRHPLRQRNDRGDVRAHAGAGPQPDRVEPEGAQQGGRVGEPARQVEVRGRGAGVGPAGVERDGGEVEQHTRRARVGSSAPSPVASQIEVTPFSRSARMASCARRAPRGAAARPSRRGRGRRSWRRARTAACPARRPAAGPRRRPRVERGHRDALRRAAHELVDPGARLRVGADPARLAQHAVDEGGPLVAGRGRELPGQHELVGRGWGRGVRCAVHWGHARSLGRSGPSPQCYEHCARGGPARRSRRRPNRFGLYQTHGNVWEHCADTGPVDYRLIPTDGRPHLGAEGAHVIRGGSWSHNPAICRSAYRDAVSPDNVGWDGRIGLRVVCELDAG